jgi:hypothetical protein
MGQVLREAAKIRAGGQAFTLFRMDSAVVKPGEASGDRRRRAGIIAGIDGFQNRVAVIVCGQETPEGGC